MGQKVNPHGFRVGVIKDWDSRWVAKGQLGDNIVADYNVRKFLKEKFAKAGVPKIEIERTEKRANIYIHCAKPGMVIGEKGKELDAVKLPVEKMMGMPVSVSAVEVKNPDLNAQLVAENIAGQLERRTAFRRAMKLAIGRTMRLGAKGIKVQLGGRLNGAEIARSEHYHEGTIPLQTIRADIDYGFAEAHTTYGRIGVKVWIYKGEVLSDSETKTKRDYNQKNNRGAKKGDRRNGDRDNRGGDRKNGGKRFDNDRKAGGKDNNGKGRFGGRNGEQKAPQNYSNRNANFKRPAKVEAAPAPVEEAPVADTAATTEGSDA